MNDVTANEIREELMHLWDTTGPRMGSQQRADYSIEVAPARRKYVSGEAIYIVKIREKAPDGKPQEPVTVQDFRSHAAWKSNGLLSPSDLGRMFLHGATVYKIAGLKRLARTRPILVQDMGNWGSFKRQVERGETPKPIRDTEYVIPVTMLPTGWSYIENDLVRNADGTTGGASAWIDAPGGVPAPIEAVAPPPTPVAAPAVEFGGFASFSAGLSELLSSLDNV